MGHVPPRVLIAPVSAASFLAGYETDLRRRMCGRTSFWSWRRRRAYDACTTLIRAREALLGYIPDPWERRHPSPPPKPISPTYVSR